MQNTPEEMALFDAVRNMRRPHSVALLEDGKVSIRKLDRDGMPLDLLPDHHLTDFESVEDALKWVKRIDEIKPWSLSWAGPG